MGLESYCLGVSGMRYLRLHLLVLIVGISSCWIVGCVAKPDRALMKSVQAGEYADARDRLTHSMSNSRRSRAYMLDRMRLVIANMGDGSLEAAVDDSMEVYDLLRVQGMNADKTVASVVINEDIKFWKGEPFEQALMYNYVAMLHGQLGDWGNARAAAESSLFLLRDFGQNADGERKSTLDIAAAAAAQDAKSDVYFDQGYSAAESNFALGHLIAGIANQAMSRPGEARDHFRSATQIDSSLESVVSKISSGSANVVLIVDAGLGPVKTAYGPDNALAKFVPLSEWQYGREGLLVAVDRSTPARFAVACDVNEMASDHMWNNLEDVRLAKSYLGTALIVGGAAVAGYGAYDDNQGAAIAGLAMILAGAIAKAGAHADTRYCEIVPQRTYVVPIYVHGKGAQVSLEVEGFPGTKLVLPWIPAPDQARERLALRYVRLNGLPEAPLWATEGKTYYLDDQYAGPVSGCDLPFILGGSCVRRPSAQTLREYQQAGWLTEYSVVDLEELYSLEGISITLNQEMARDEVGKGRDCRHVLEGGHTLAAPQIGSAGYQRVFGQLHSPYRPKSKEVRELMNSIAERRAQNELVAIQADR